MIRLKHIKHLGIAFFIGLLPIVSCAHRPLSGPTGRPERQTLLIALDGVPYSMVAAMKSKGKFAGFQEPSRVVTTFPSISHTGFGGIFRPLGATPPPGYDREYYSYDEEKIVGFLSSVNPKSPHDFKMYFDYSRKTPSQKFWIYAAPGLSGRRDLEKIRDMVWKHSERNHYFTYIGGTDGAGHILGEDRMRRWLEFMDQFLTKMRSDYRRAMHQDLEVVLFSDHGFHFWQKPKSVSRASIENHLKKMGLTFAKDLKKDENVVAIQWGNISGASFYVHDSHVEPVAQILAKTPGIDVVAYRLNQEVHVVALRGDRVETAEISCDEKRKHCRYRPEIGDPLNYGAILDELKREKKLNAAGYASSEDWFRLTKNEHYPDALYRLHDGLFTLVGNPAQILFSTQDDYEYGDFWTRVGAWFHGGLKGTHGGLFSDATSAFVMTTDPKIRFQPVLRYDQVMPVVFSCGSSHERIVSCPK